jgi:periplasmic protein TonB
MANTRISLLTIAALFVVTAIGSAQTARKITQAEAMTAVITKIQPEYPALARQLKIAGSVDLDVLIAENGSVETVTPVSGNPVLTKPAAETLKKWKFKPIVHDGAPVKAQVVIKINFSN